jgi:hypothetical protein
MAQALGICTSWALQVDEPTYFGSEDRILLGTLEAEVCLRIRYSSFYGLVGTENGAAVSIVGVGTNQLEVESCTFSSIKQTGGARGGVMFVQV